MKARLELEVDRIVGRSATYVQLAQNESLFQLGTEDAQHASNEELENVYDRVLVKGGERPAYNKIRSSAPLNVCPLCFARFVKSVDHYLPKSDFPELSVVYRNLVPCCSDCNKTKGTEYGETAETQLFHPYFDDWGDWFFLIANVEINEGVDVAFSVEQPDGMPDLAFERATNHLETLGLAALYSDLSAVELGDGKAAFQEHHADGEDVLRRELQRLSASAARRNRNSWRAAMYRGLSTCHDFLSGGFEFIPD
ncbi:HNH endonuclease [Phaeobacter marinintestinus]|uniref:HNH endonuclease n=1 Tax=Falsiphaeobacter marinintestinus TaxID=1492905 RepID=UPI0016479F0A|nr:HNH endonuclease [Phaeobacter marinintestinus]